MYDGGWRQPVGRITICPDSGELFFWWGGEASYCVQTLSWCLEQGVEGRAEFMVVM